MRVNLNLKVFSKNLIKKENPFNNKKINLNSSSKDSFAPGTEEVEILKLKIKYLEGAKRFHSDRLRNMPPEKREFSGAKEIISKLRKELWAYEKKLVELEKKSSDL